MRIFRYILFVLLVFVVGCSTSKTTSELIERSMNVAQECPDSAMLYIERVDASTIRGKRDMARYRLAYSEALYYNQIDSDCDSLTRPLFDYYYYSDSHAERARAMYQHGWVMNNASNRAEAMYALMEAEKSLQHCDNPRLLGLVHRTKGDIYGKECLFNDALNCHIRAKESFDEAGLVLHSMYSVSEIAQSYLRLREYDKAIEFFNLSEQLAMDNGDLELATIVQSELCMAYIYVSDISKCRDVLERIDLSIISEWNICYYLCAKAICQSKIGEYQSAVELLESARQYADDYMQLYINYTDYTLATSVGDYSKALAIYRDMVKVQDGHFFDVMSSSVLHSEIKQLKEDVIYTQELNARMRQITYLVMLIVVLILSFLMFVLYVGNKRKLFLIATLKEQVDSVKQELSNQNRLNEHLSNVATEKERSVIAMKRQLNDNIGVSLQNIDSLLSAYYADNTKQVKQKQIVDAIDRYVYEFASSKNGYCAVEEYVNQYRNNIMQILRAEVPTLGENEYMLLCLVYADFSTNAICMFMGYDKNKLYKHKCRLKAKIAETKCKSMSILLRYL